MLIVIIFYEGNHYTHRHTGNFDTHGTHGNHYTHIHTGNFDTHGTHGNHENNAKFSNQNRRKCALDFM